MDEEIKKRVFNFFKSHQLAVIATSSLSGKPEAAVVEYITDDDWNFYFLTHDDTQKAKNLEINKSVAIVIGLELSPNTLQIEGSAETIRSGEDHFEDVLIRFGHNELFYISPLLKLRKLNLIMVKVTPNRIRWLDFNENSGREEYIEIKL